jgi:glycosyltransferase involved in cell wall biosynthesis
MISLSVIICTHNPRPNYFRRVLRALREQTVAKEEWELLVIDNASTEPVETWADTSWHPHARHVREMTLGIAWARIRGISEARAELLLFVDDDNVLSSDYLAQAKAIAAEHPELGAWSGNVQLEFEQPPPEWTKPYWPLLAAREVLTDAQGRSTVHDVKITPVGAGMCFRREVGLFYRDQWLKSPIRKFFGARGQSCTLGEDTDLALTACDMGMETGLFARLKLTHLMPPNRLTQEYLLRLYRGVGTSSFLMQLLRKAPVRRLPQGFRWWVKFLYDAARKWGRKGRFFRAQAMAKREALRIFVASQDLGNEQTQREPVVPREFHPRS